MKEQNRISVPGVGGASLLVIFAVLCLTVFSMLCLSTVLAEQRMAEASMQSTADYYEADLQAQKIFARLRNGERVPGVETVGTVYSFSCEISENQRLEVQLQKEGTVWKVLRWQAVAVVDETNETFPVWDGA